MLDYQRQLATQCCIIKNTLKLNAGLPKATSYSMLYYQEHFETQCWIIQLHANDVSSVTV